MKTKTLFLLMLVLAASCKKESFDSDYLLSNYQPVCDVWKPLSVTYDSMGLSVTKSIEYDRLVINDNLSYVIYYDQGDNVVEDGNIRIVTQTDDELEIAFGPVYPMTSSYAGSHIFSFSDVVLESLTNDEMILTTSEWWQFQNVEFHFEKY